MGVFGGDFLKFPLTILGVWLYFLRGFFFFNFSFCGCGGTLLLFVQHSFNINFFSFFCVFGGSVSVGHVLFCFWGTINS